MSALAVILSVLILALVVAVVSAPLRAARRSTAADGRSREAREAGAAGWTPEGALEAREDLEAAREAKYREIRDAELDYRTGKLSLEDYRAIDSGLRAEAIEILDRLEGPAAPEPPVRPTDA